MARFFEILFLLFIAVFFTPIAWLANKIKGGGCGAGPAFASFFVSAIIMLFGVVCLSLTVVGVVSYFLIK